MKRAKTLGHLFLFAFACFLIAVLLAASDSHAMMNCQEALWSEQELPEITYCEPTSEQEWNEIQAEGNEIEIAGEIPQVATPTNLQEGSQVGVSPPVHRSVDQAPASPGKRPSHKVSRSCVRNSAPHRSANTARRKGKCKACHRLCKRGKTHSHR